MRIEVYGRFGNFFAFFSITKYRRRDVCFLFQTHLDLLNLRVSFEKFVFHECLFRKVPRSGRVLTAFRSMSSVFYKELKRHPLHAVHKVGAYCNVLSVTPTRKLSVASTKKQQQTTTNK